MMRLARLESELSGVSQPILSVYLAPIPNGTTGRRCRWNSLPWLTKQAKTLGLRVPAAQRKAFQREIDRVERFLRSSSVGSRALVLFSSPARLIRVPLPFAVANELQWGQPAFTQLRRIAEEHQGACVVAVDRGRARFFKYELGELAELPAMKFEIDSSQWKRKEHAHMARRDTPMPHGLLRDAFERRMDEQYHRFFKHISERIKFVCAREKLQIVLLVGSHRLTKQVESLLPHEMRERTLPLDEDLAKIAPAKLEARILPKVSEWMTRFARNQVARLLESDGAAVVGLDETLAQLQKGRVGTLLMVRGLDADLRQCANCGDLSRSAGPACIVCGSGRRKVVLSQVLDELAAQHHVEVQILDPDAAKALTKAGGIGGWLRQPPLVAVR